MGAVVIDDQVQLQILGHLLVDAPQKAEELLMAMPWLALGDHRTGGHIEGSKQGGSAVADVVMGHALHVAQAHRQQWLGAIQSLDLRFLVNAEHDSVLGRIQVQADDVAHLLHKEGIGGELVAVRLPRSGDASAGAAAPRRSAASGARCSWRCPWLPPVSGHSSGCCHRLAWSAGRG